MKLYTYWRSTAAYRVRIALNLKGESWQSVPVHLVRDGGEQHQAAYRNINPQGLVPALEHDGAIITQSLAILEYLDECFPAPPLLPVGAVARARVRSLAAAVACDIHPLNNLRVLQYLGGPLGLSKDARDAWYQHWIADGFTALEAALAGSDKTGRFCHGDTPTIADCCLVPQVFNAHRFDCDMSAYPTALRINDTCLGLAAFASAAPQVQADAD